MNTKDVIKHFGSASQLAKELKVSRSAVSQWGPTVPFLRQFQIRELMAEKERKIKEAA